MKKQVEKRSLKFYILTPDILCGRNSKITSDMFKLPEFLEDKNFNTKVHVKL